MGQRFDLKRLNQTHAARALDPVTDFARTDWWVQLQSELRMRQAVPFQVVAKMYEH